MLIMLIIIQLTQYINTSGLFMLISELLAHLCPWVLSSTVMSLLITIFFLP